MIICGWVGVRLFNERFAEVNMTHHDQVLEFACSGTVEDTPDVDVKVTCLTVAHLQDKICYQYVINYM